MRMFAGAWGFVAVGLSVVLIPTVTHWRWGYATAACGVLLLAVFASGFRVPVWAAVAGMVSSVVATAAGLARSGTQVCCMFAVTERRGYPFGWLVRGADYVDLPGLVPPASFADDAAWTVDRALLLGDLAVWGVIGLAVMVGFSVVMRQAGRVGLLRIRRGSSLDSGNA
jgi:hypothetical protein